MFTYQFFMNPLGKKMSLTNNLLGKTNEHHKHKQN